MSRAATRRPTAARRPAPAPRRGLGGILVRVAAFGVLFWLGGFTWFVATRPGAAPLALATDGVVVLTGGAGRLARGHAVLAAGAAKRMLVSGVGAHVRKADLAATLDAPPRRFAARVDLGFAAVDTISNAVETTAWVKRHDYRSVRLVTSAAHMRRARLELDAQLPPSVRIVPDAVPVAAGTDSLAREFSKYLARRAALVVGGI